MSGSSAYIGALFISGKNHKGSLSESQLNAAVPPISVVIERGDALLSRTTGEE